MLPPARRTPTCGSGSSRRRTELPFAGHPTLGTAFVLGGPLQQIVIRLETGAGVVPVELEREGAEDHLRLDGAADPDRGSRSTHADDCSRCSASSGSGLPVELYDLGPGHVYVELRSPRQVAALGPTSARSRRATEDGVNCFARDGARWKTRMFAPGRRRRRGSCDRLRGGAARRPPRPPRPDRLRRGDRDPPGRRARAPLDALRRVEGTADGIERVRVGGSAVVVARGEFRLP